MVVSFDNESVSEPLPELCLSGPVSIRVSTDYESGVFAFSTLLFIRQGTLPFSCGGKGDWPDQRRDRDVARTCSLRAEVQDVRGDLVLY